MISDERIREGYLKRFGRPMEDIDLIAFKRFASGFQAEHFETFDEIQEAIQASMRILSEDLMECQNTHDSKELLRSRVGWTQK